MTGWKEERSTPIHRRSTRRRFLSAGSLLGTLIVAGCLSTDGTNSEPTSEEPTEDTVTDTGGPFHDSGENVDAEVVIYWFWGDGCPYCASQKPFMKEIAGRDGVEVVALEVYYDKDNRERYQEFAEAYDINREAVPLTFIGTEYWIGYSDEIKSEMKAKVNSCLESNCSKPTDPL